MGYQIAIMLEGSRGEITTLGERELPLFLIFILFERQLKGENMSEYEYRK